MKIQINPENNELTFHIWGTFWQRNKNKQLTGAKDGTMKKIKIIKVDLSDINDIDDLWDVLVEIK